MQFVKTHWILLLCGVVALAAIGLAVVGMTSNTVVQEMESRVQAAAAITTLRSDPQNEETINAEKERGRLCEQEFEAVVRTAETINERQPLMEGAFPKPAELPTQYRFRDAYVKKVYELPRGLKAGDLPGPQELNEEAEIIIEEDRRKRQEQGDDVTVATPAPVAGPAAPPPPGPTGGARGGGMMRGGGMPAGGRGGRGAAGGGPPAGGGQDVGSTPALQGLPSGVSMDDVVRRASVKKARSIRVYAVPESFQISPIMSNPEAPSPREMWYAQVSLWVQEDLVKAIGELNEAAAQQAGDNEAHVGNMPVKRIESVQVWGYITSTGDLVPFPAEAAPTAAGAAGQPPTMAPSFTSHSKSDEQFDVVRVTLTAVVDQRDILKLVDSITRTNFYQLVGIEYERVESQDAKGYLYGPDPVVRVVLDFEGYMARKMYKGLMPTEVQQDLGIVAAPAEVTTP